MNKFRPLTFDELQLFEKEFREYLAINGIDADLWKDIKENDPDKAQSIMDLFGDVVFNTVLTKITYLERIDDKGLKLFKYNPKEALLIGIDGLTDKEQSIEHILSKAKKGDLSLFTLKKEHQKSREEEVFQMIKLGCQVSDGELFEAFSRAIS